MKRFPRYPIAVTLSTLLGLAFLFGVAQLPWPERPAIFGGETLTDTSAEFQVDLVECSTLMEPLEGEIKQMIELGRECTSDEQCLVAGFGCPFGCGSVVNRDAVPGIREAVNRYSRLGETCGMCAYQCRPWPAGQAVCENNQCTFRRVMPDSIWDLIEAAQ